MEAPMRPRHSAHVQVSHDCPPPVAGWGSDSLTFSGPPNFASRLSCVRAAHRCKECRRCDAAGRQEVGFNGGIDEGTHRMCAVRYASVHGVNSGIPQPVPPARCWLASSGCWPAAMYASPGPSGARPLVGCLEGHPRRICAADEGVPHAHLTRLPAHSSLIHALIGPLTRPSERPFRPGRSTVARACGSGGHSRRYRCLGDALGASDGHRGP